MRRDSRRGTASRGIAEAFRRLEAGTYGRCVVCDEPVDFERLLIFPEAPNCSACAGR